MKGYPTEAKTVGEHLKRRRIEKGVKQSELAVFLAVHRGSIQLWESGIGEPGVRQFPEIIRFLDYVPFRKISGNGGTIAYLRQCAGLTQEELAKEIQCNAGTIARWEHGRPGKTNNLARAVEGLWARLRQLRIEAVVRAALDSETITLL